jgi:hypothetical protein
VNFSKPSECDKEARVVEAARASSWEPELRQHASTCPACSGALLAARVLNQMRGADLAEARVPDAGLLWRKAQLLAKQEAAERATQPISFIERFTYAWAALCAMGVCVWQWPAIRGRMDPLVKGPAILASVGNSFFHFFQSAVESRPEKSVHLQGFDLVLLLSVGALLAFVAGATYFTRSEE